MWGALSDVRPRLYYSVVAGSRQPAQSFSGLYSAGLLTVSRPVYVGVGLPDP
jgi:hypothetical protein